MAEILVIARSLGPARIRPTRRWILDPATRTLVCVREEDPLSRLRPLQVRLAA